MSVYIEFIKKSFQQRYTYKVNTYIYLLGSLITLLIQINVWYALLGERSVKGITFDDMINFVIINMIVRSLTYSSIANRLAEKIQNGLIAIDFIRPINLKYYLISEEIGRNCFNAIFNSIPVCMVAIVFFKFQLPVSTMGLILFIISILNGMSLILFLNYVLGLLCFWFKTAFSINWFLNACTALFSGFVVPLWFYPEWLLNISKVLPFRLISFEPISIYLGKLSVAESVKVIIIQYIWIIILLILEKVIWKKAQRIITVQGG